MEQHANPTYDRGQVELSVSDHDERIEQLYVLIAELLLKNHILRSRLMEEANDEIPVF